MARKRKSPPRNVERLLAKRMRDLLVYPMDIKIETYLIRNYEKKHQYLENRLYRHFNIKLFAKLLTPLKKFLKLSV